LKKQHGHLGGECHGLPAQVKTGKCRAKMALLLTGKPNGSLLGMSVLRRRAFFNRLLGALPIHVVHELAGCISVLGKRWYDGRLARTGLARRVWAPPAGDRRDACRTRKALPQKR
jgi:hypothetical protein